MPSFQFPGIIGAVHDMIEWDPDGPGPQTSLYIFGGEFALAGTEEVQNIASLDPLTGEWGDLAGGITNAGFGTTLVNTLAVLPSGELLVGGNFGRAGGVSARSIASWNGDSWSPFGPRLDSAVTDIAITPMGDLYIAGPYSQQGPPERLLRWVAKWNGTEWLPLGSGMDNIVWTLHAMPNGDLIAGGLFSSAGGVFSPRIARWDGASWHHMAIGGEVFAITSLPNGDVIAGGAFVATGGTTVNRVARWDGAQWNALGSGFDKPVHALAVLANGDVVAGGEFEYTGALTCRGAAQWNGSAWSQVGGGISGAVNALALASDGSVLMGGQFANAGEQEHRNIVQWRDGSFSTVAPGLDGQVFASAVMPNGDFVIAGSFTQVNDVQANHIARWDGISWHPFGSGMDDDVLALEVLNSGQLVAAGHFRTAGGTSAKFIARWTGSTWVPVSGGMNAYVNRLAVAPNGDLIAAGAFRVAGAVSAANHIARWNGIFWQPFGTGFPGSIEDAPVASLAVMPNGHVIAGGRFNEVGGSTIYNIARWSGSSWSQLSSAITFFDEVAALAVGPDQLLYVGGDVLNSTVARWDGADWAVVGSSSSELRGIPNSIYFLPNGDLIAAGDLKLNGSTAGLVHRWDGSQWRTLDSGFGAGDNSPGDVGRTIALDATGDLWISGRLLRTEGLVSAHMARWRAGGAPEVTSHPTDVTTCPEVASAFFVAVLSEQTPTFKWQVESLEDPGSWIDLVDGQTSEHGIVAGATTELLSLSSYGQFSESSYRCVVTSMCGQSESLPAALVLDDSECQCIADYNGAPDPGDILDFLDFFEDFSACSNLPAPCGQFGNADVNGDDFVDILDFLDFMESFGQGC